MSIFSKMSEPEIFKESNSAEKKLAQLQAIDASQLTDTLKKQLKTEIEITKAGIDGEKEVLYELRNSHLPIYVLHDLYLEHGDCSAQIDFLVITRRRCFVIECKNLQGTIEINEKGDFIQTKYGKEECIYSPMAQNDKHLAVIKGLRGQARNAFLRYFFEKNFDNNYRSVIVLANKKVVPKYKNAPKEVKSQIIRYDGLKKYIEKENDAYKDSYDKSDKEMEDIAKFFKEAHIERDIDYTTKYRTSVPVEQATPLGSKTHPNSSVLCPKCGAEMVLRTAKKGANVGKQFWGCSNFPNCSATVEAGSASTIN
jgi:predicted RNA-binding Zn-ribbon protein involved in translation (DUF1610 family)